MSRHLVIAAIVIGWVLVLLFVWALCSAASRGDDEAGRP